MFVQKVRNGSVFRGSSVNWEVKNFESRTFEIGKPTKICTRLNGIIKCNFVRYHLWKSETYSILFLFRRHALIIDMASKLYLKNSKYWPHV